MERAHVVQPVSQLDQQHADVVGHRQQELAQILGGALVFGLRLDLRQFGDAIDQPRDVGTEHPLNLFRRGDGVLDRIVQDCRGDGFIIEMKVGQDAGDLDRMTEIGVTRGAFLAAMCL